MMSKPLRASWLFGSSVAVGTLTVMRSTGPASTRIAITVPVSTTTGWAMTQSDQRRQNRLSPCLRPRTRSEFTR